MIHTFIFGGRRHKKATWALSVICENGRRIFTAFLKSTNLWARKEIFSLKSHSFFQDQSRIFFFLPESFLLFSTNNFVLESIWDYTRFSFKFSGISLGFLSRWSVTYTQTEIYDDGRDFHQIFTLMIFTKVTQKSLKEMKSFYNTICWYAILLW